MPLFATWLTSWSFKSLYSYSNFAYKNPTLHILWALNENVIWKYRSIINRIGNPRELNRNFNIYKFVFRVWDAFQRCVTNFSQGSLGTRQYWTSPGPEVAASNHSGFCMTSGPLLEKCWYIRRSWKRGNVTNTSLSIRRANGLQLQRTTSWRCSGK
jgi:hypothetical protein